ncbi:hypothetical protein PSENEW3_00001526 [Picochlorum sp. SENEW3]|nr:hypothetical protein PSENEW3_00001526 [Picochlorum sp. SENEW3]
MRKTQVYVEDPWDVDSYATKLKTLYRAMHGLKRTSPVDNAKVRQYSEWLVRKVDELYSYLREKYTNLSVLSSMMLPVASALRQELGEDHAITTKWRNEATELRYRADEEASHNVQDEDFKTYQEICNRRDSIREQLDKEPSHTIQYWQWFALCLYTMQPPLRADWATLSIVDSVDKASTGQNHLVLTSDKAVIPIQQDKVSHRKGGAHIPVTDELHSVLLGSIRQFPRSVVVPYTSKSSQNPLHRSYSPDKHISKVNLSKLLSQAMASPQDNTPWPRPIQGLRKAHSTLVMSSNASYHTIKQVADAQRHSVSTMLCHYNAVSPCCSVEDDTKASTPEKRIASAMQQTGLCHSNVIIMTHYGESHRNGSPAWTLYCSNPDLQEPAEQGLAIIQEACSSRGQ